MIKRSNQYKNIPDNWKYIKRSNNPEKSIALKARFILCVVLDQIKKYRDGYKFTLAKNAEEILQNSLNKRGGFYE